MERFTAAAALGPFIGSYERFYARLAVSRLHDFEQRARSPLRKIDLVKLTFVEDKPLTATKERAVPCVGVRSKRLHVFAAERLSRCVFLYRVLGAVNPVSLVSIPLMCAHFKNRFAAHLSLLLSSARSFLFVHFFGFTIVAYCPISKAFIVVSPLCPPLVSALLFAVHTLARPSPVAVF